MLIDCDSCYVRGLACGDCVVTVLLGGPPHGVQLDAEEQVALDVLAAAGMVPPLRLVFAPGGDWSDAAADAPIPYGVAYRHSYPLPLESSPGAAAEAG